MVNKMVKNKILKNKNLIHDLIGVLSIVIIIFITKRLVMEPFIVGDIYLTLIGSIKIIFILTILIIIELWYIKKKK